MFSASPSMRGSSSTTRNSCRRSPPAWSGASTSADRCTRNTDELGRRSALPPFADRPAPPAGLNWAALRERPFFFAPVLFAPGDPPAQAAAHFVDPLLVHVEAIFLHRQRGQYVAELLDLGLKVGDFHRLPLRRRVLLLVH